MRRLVAILIALASLCGEAKAQISQSITGIGVGNATIMGGSLPGTHVADLCVAMSPFYPLFYGSLNIFNAVGQNASGWFQVVHNSTTGKYEVVTTGGIVPAGTYNGTLIATQDSITNTSQKFEQTVTFTVVAP